MYSDYTYLFIITYGRSGSTVLMRLLNAAPDIDIKGENYAALEGLFQSVNSAERALQHIRGDTDGPDHPWYGASAVDAVGYRTAMIDAFVTHVLRPPEGARRIGFKEIRHRSEQMTDETFESYVTFLLTTFPDARIIFNTRDWRSVAKSAWLAARSRARVRRDIEATDARFRKAHATMPERTMMFDYSDLQADSARLSALMDFVGADLSEDEVAAVLARPLTHTKRPRKLSLPTRALRKMQRLLTSSG